MEGFDSNGVESAGCVTT